MKLPPLSPARLVRRYNRFLADVTLEPTGEVITAHCPNPGSLMGLKAPGSRVWLSRSDNPKRKLAHTLELVEADGTLVSINTQRPNALAAEAISTGTIAALAGYQTCRREVAYGAASRVDFLLSAPDRADCYVEVKNCHLMRAPGLAEFPDSVTSRGAKHLRELSAMVVQGHRAVMLFIVQRGDCQRFATAPDLDPAYHVAFEAARTAGVEILCHACHVELTAITVARPLEIQSARAGSPR